METGFLPGTFRFNYIKYPKLFNFIILITTLALPLYDLGFPLTQRVHAAKWFTTSGGGVLSGGGSGWSIIDDDIPGTVTAGFYPKVIQTGSNLSLTSFGTLISSGDQLVLSNGSSTDDPYVKNISSDISTPSVSSIIDDLESTDVDLSPLPWGGAVNCYNFFAGAALNPNSIYHASVSCFNNAIDVAGVPGGRYQLTNLPGSGLVILLVGKVSGSETVNFSRVVKALDGNSERLLILTDAETAVVTGVGTIATGLTFDSAPHIEAAVLTSTSATAGFVVEENTTNAVIVEGPITSVGSVSLGRSITHSYPGVFIKYNPFYVSELSKKGYNGLAVKGLLESKVTWRYE